MVAMNRTTQTLLELSPTAFENLTFDLMIARGMVNVAWRTPGADGGRDIEGITFERDISGVQTSTKWFVECKRYTGSVDWPTIYGKLAYADSMQADVLLMCTSSQYTPAAISQVDNWNASKRPVKIRLWPRNQIESILSQHPDISLKYGLSNLPSTPGASIVTLSLALSKAVGTHYSSLIFKNETPDLMLEAAQALADLLLHRMEDINRDGRIRPAFFPAGIITIQNCTFDEGPLEVDEPAFRAFVSYLTALTKQSLKIHPASDNKCTIECQYDFVDVFERYRSTFDSIALWGDFDYLVSNSTIEICQRK